MPTARFLPTPNPVISDDVTAAMWAETIALPQDSLAIAYGAPGVGKTTLLRKRFKALVLEMGLAPEQVLVLSATRESATSLRDELLFELSGSVDESLFAVEGSLARTLASLAFAIVRQHSLANQLPAPELISGAEQDTLIRGLLSGPVGAQAEPLWPPHIGEVTRGLSGFRAELRDLLASCQEHGLTAAALRNLAGQKSEWLAAAVIFEGYEELLKQPEFQNRYDSAGLINRAIELIGEAKDAPAFEAILIDDAQELTPAGKRLVELLSGSSAGLTCFGDPDASTLGFRQSDPQLMTDLVSGLAAARGVAAREIVLTEDPWGKPSGVSRVQAKVASLIGVVGPGRQRKVHGVQPTVESSDLSVKVLSSKQSEVDWLSYQLRKAHLIDGIPWSRMAVVARTRQQLDELERSLGAQSVPVRIAGAQSALRDEYASRELLEFAAYLCLNLPLSAEAAERLLRSPFCGLDSLGMRRLRRDLRREELAGQSDDSQAAPSTARNSDELILELFKTPAAAETLRGLEGYRVRSFLKSVQKCSLIASDPTKTIEDLLWAIWQSSGLEKLWTEAGRGTGEVAIQANRNLDAVVALFAAANRFVERNPGGAKELFLEIQLEQALPEDSLALARRTDEFVSLLTPAGLVGRRFDIVSAPQLLEGIWPNLKPRNSLLGANLIGSSLGGDDSRLPRQELSDELRMFYKTVGASNRQVLISSYIDPDEQVSQFLAHAAGGDIPQEEDFAESALTLRGLAGSLRRRLATETDPAMRASLAVDLGRLAQAGVPGAHPDDWFGLAELSTLEPLFEFVSGDASEVNPEATSDQGERITLNPSQLEAFVKCPLHWFLNYHGASGSDFSASIGTLVHRALELAKTGTEEELWAQVETGWHSLRFETDWLEKAERRRAQKLVANLAKYLRDFDLSGGTVIAREQEFEFDLGLAHVRGKVDRIEKLSDGSVLIVDLKTGRTLPSLAEAQKNPQLGLYQVAHQNGAFREALVGNDELANPSSLAGAKLLLVAGDSPAIREQESIADNPDLQAYFEGLIKDSAAGMAMPDRVFVARVSNHCDAEGEFGTCSLHLRRAVSYAD